jgi:hypothetical protein
MSSPIRYRETTDASSSMDTSDRLALRFDPTRRVTLRFHLQVDSDEDLEALRYARRVMIREERTRGLEWEEPSIDEAIFTVSDVSWSVLAAQAAWCRQKVEDLVARANRIRADFEAPGAELHGEGDPPGSG